MYFLYFVSLFLSLDFVLTQMKPGTCSKSCKTLVQTPDASGSTLQKLPCSCSKSCLNYNDCCFDSPFRNSGENMKPSHTKCLSVADKGSYKAVSGCPKEWSQTSYFCTSSIGYHPPVTSETTGITYANGYCAACNGEKTDLKTWPVELRCCPEHEGVERKFFYHRGKLWSTNRSGNKCICRYHFNDSDTSFLDDLEVRTCELSAISRCSSTRRNREQEQLCKSFLDPIYLEDKVYRNQYCALCNNKALENAQCMPSVVARMLSEGADDAEILNQCQANNLSDCLYYMKSSNRGQSPSFPKMLDERTPTCIPTSGERCCRGERYDSRAKRCRKIAQ